VSLKNEMKMGLLHEQGVKADDLLEAAVKRQSAHDGAKQALRQISKNISGLAALVDRDMDEDKIPLTEPTQVAAYVKLMIDRCAQMSMSAAAHQENLQISVGGEITAYQSMVDAIKKEILSEQSKLQAIKQAVASGEISSDGEVDLRAAGRPTGVRPGLGIAAQRRAEAMVEASTDGSVVETPAPEKPNGRRGGKKKAS
jgi:hypothetical protein